MKKFHFPHNRLIAALLVVVCLLGLLPTAAFAADAPGSIKMDDCTHNGVKYESPALSTCHLHQMHFGFNGKSTMGFCAEKGKGMGWSLEGHTWNSPQSVSDPTVTTMMAYFYAHSTGVFTDQAHALGVDDVWSSDYTWTMNAWVQAIVWRYKAGMLSDPVTACAEELLCVYNNLEHTNYSSIDDLLDGTSFRGRAQYILDLGAQGVWGECEVYEYAYAGPGSSYHPANDVQAIMIGKLTVSHEQYTLIIKKVDSTNPNKTLPGARFKVASENGAYSKEVVTGGDGTVTVPQLEAGTYAVTELEAPEGYEIDNAGPQYVVLPNGTNKIVTVTFSDTPIITGEGSIRKVDADDPTKGLAGAVIKITGVDNDFTGTYVTGTGGYLTDVPWKDMPIGSYTAEEVTPPEGYTKSPDVSKTKQTFVWDGKTDVALVFENDAKVKVKLIKLDDSDNPLPGAVFNIIKDGQIIGTEATKADGSITVTDVTEGMYAFVEVSAPAPYATLTEPVIAHVDQATINGGGTVTVTAADKRLPSLTILKRDAQTKEVIPGTVFEIKGIHYHYHDDVTTGPDGRAVLTNIPMDSYEVTEKSVPDPYVVGEEPTQTIYLGPGENRELIFDNLKQPVLKISKVEQGTNTPIPGTVFTVEGIDSDYRHDVTTEADGFATLRVAPGSYRVTEKSVPAPYCLPEDEADRTQTISLNGGDEKTLIFKNSKKPLLTLSKIDADTGVPVPGTVLTVEGIDSDYKDDWRTGPDGTVALRVDPGTYRITEKSVPAPYYLPDKDADRVQTISLNPGDEKTVVFRNHKTPELTIFKEDSVAGAPIEGAKFRVTYTSNGESAGAPAYMDFGIFVTDASGQIKLHEKGKKLYPGEYTVTEVEPAPGYQMKEPTTQKVILHGGESKTLTFFNEPLNAIVVEKYDNKGIGSYLLYYYYEPAMTACSASVLLQENTTTAKLESLSAPAGTFYAGQNVPITAKFSYPLKVTSDMTITVNGKALTPQNAGTVTDTVTYLYKVGDSSGGSVSVTATAFEGAGRTCTGANTLDVTVTEGTALNKGELSGLRLESIDREKAFDAPQLTVTKDENNKPRLNVTVHLSGNKVYTNWVLSELAGSDNNELTSLQVITNQTGSERFSFVPDNPDTPTALTAAIDLPYNTSTSAIDLAADFFLDNAVWMGKGLTTQVEGSKPIPAEDMTPKLIVTPADGGAGSNYDPDNKPPVLYAEQGSDLTLNIGLTGSNYTWGDTTKVTADPDDTGAHFLWKSSNPAVATVRIDDRGVSLIPTGQAGTTTITLTALNGALTDAESAGIEVEFAVGSDPFLLIPASGRTVAIRQGQDAVVSWTSNICQKNQTGGEAGGFAETVFDVRLSYETGNETVTVEKAGLPPAVQSALTTSAENPVISSVTLPWEGLLGDIYAKNVRSLTVEVSTSYLGKSYGTYTPEDGEKVENATATITMTSRPAAVTLAEPIGGLYQVDRSGGLTLPLTWTVEDLDTTATGQGKFELYITRDGWDGTITETKLAGDGGNVTKNGDQYTYNFQVPEVELTSDPTSYRDSYSITVKAKNAAEATWSSSSYVLYVYSDQALKIMLDGAEAGSDLIMSNQERIANLWGGGGENGSKAIVALQRDIALKNVISANYGEYAWAELADQIAWNSSDSSVATVNYQQGTLYENIEHFSYTSYRPTTDFVLSGLKDGSTTVTARHVKTNLTDDLLVRVETLRDQLYLFQCYPKTETELTYYTWLDKEHIRKSAVSTLKTNANGEAAIYAPYQHPGGGVRQERRRKVPPGRPL